MMKVEGTVSVKNTRGLVAVVVLGGAAAEVDEVEDVAGTTVVDAGVVVEAVEVVRRAAEVAVGGDEDVDGAAEVAVDGAVEVVKAAEVVLVVVGAAEVVLVVVGAAEVVVVGGKGADVEVVVIAAEVVVGATVASRGMHWSAVPFRVYWDSHTQWQAAFCVLAIRRKNSAGKSTPIMQL